MARILEYTPAPGQFINEEARSGGAFDNVDSARRKPAGTPPRVSPRTTGFRSADGADTSSPAFAEPVPNTGRYDPYVKGNAMNTSSEPGVVWVMQDANGNGMPDDTWYEQKGSEYDNAATIRGNAVTYTPLADGSAAWTDDRGGSGTIDRMDEHTQASYCPAWIEPADLKFTGTRLRDNVEQADGQWRPQAFAWGYADNFSTVDRIGTTNRLRISDAVTADGSPANLQQIDFIKVQTGVNAKAPLIGEISTEVCGIGCYRTVTKRN